MFKKTLVCLDGSSLAEEILPLIVGQCIGLKNEIILLQVITAHITIPPPQSTHVLTFGIPSKPHQIHTTDIGKSTTLEPKVGLELREIEREQGESKFYLDSLADRYRSKDVKIRTVSLQGDAVETILNYAKKSQASVLALTTHGSGGLKRGLLGRVAQLVLQESEIPVLIVKPRGPKSPEKPRT
jgi:nucleotide-binding universal stress UspA family protein